MTIQPEDPIRPPHYFMVEIGKVFRAHGAGWGIVGATVIAAATVFALYLWLN